MPTSGGVPRRQTFKRKSVGKVSRPLCNGGSERALVDAGGVGVVTGSFKSPAPSVNLINSPSPFVRVHRIMATAGRLGLYDGVIEAEIYYVDLSSSGFAPLRGVSTRVCLVRCRGGRRVRGIAVVPLFFALSPRPHLGSVEAPNDLPGRSYLC